MEARGGGSIRGKLEILTTRRSFLSLPIFNCRFFLSIPLCFRTVYFIGIKPTTEKRKKGRWIAAERRMDNNAWAGLVDRRTPERASCNLHFLFLAETKKSPCVDGVAAPGNDTTRTPFTTQGQINENDGKSYIQLSCIKERNLFTSITSWWFVGYSLCDCYRK